MDFDISKLIWINKPKKFEISANKITIITEPETDFWQKTYYGFSNVNAHALMQSISEDFTFLVETNSNTKLSYDQCGVVIYKDSKNWFKASVEYENKQYSKLGSVVTNIGYSDWATTDISTDIHKMWYRLSRKKQDFLIENSCDGVNFKQMRIFHMHTLINKVNVGVYAASPLMSSFTAVFANMKLTDSIWQEHII